MIQKGAFNAASDLFETTLKNLRGKLLDCAPSDMTSEELTIRTGAPLHVTSVDRESESVFSLFDRPLLFDDEGSDSSVLGSVDCQRRVTSVLLYNLALTCHVKAMRGVSQRRLLRKALKIYRMAAGLSEDFQGTSQYDPVVHLACLNNMGHIYAFFFETVKVQECLKSLTSVLGSYHHTCPGQALDATSYLEADFSEFCLTVMLFHDQVTNAIAPAA